MKKLALALLFFALAPETVLAARMETLNFECRGPNVSAAITLRRAGTGFRAPYTTQTKLIISGRRVNERITGTTTFFEQEIPFGRGAWKYDDSRIVYALGGAELNLTGLREGFHLEVKDGSFGYVIGYLGHRDHEQSPVNNSAYDFNCWRR